MRISDWSSDVCSSDLEMREEGAGDVADAFGVEEIVLHEAFDRALAGAVGEFHPARDLAVEIAGQPVLGAPREDVERRSLVEGKRVAVRVGLGVRRTIKTKPQHRRNTNAKLHNTRHKITK